VRAQAGDISGAVTVSLTTDYLAPAEPGAWLEAVTDVEKLGGRLAFADCSVTADGREVVRARAVFSVLD
jgi:acyl-coenzyme A thioesterase PaaI-like protein